MPARIVPLRAVVFAAVVGVGCRARSDRVPPLAAVGSNEHVTASPALVDLAVRVRPRLGGEPRLEIDVTARSDDLPRRFVVQRSWGGERDVLQRLVKVRARCDGRAVPLEVDDLGTHQGWTMPTRCREATVSYAALGRPHWLDWGSEYDVVVGRALATAIAEIALLLPDVPDETRARVEVQFDLGEMPGAEGVYSLGPGVHDTTTRAARHAFFAMGRFVTVRTQHAKLTMEVRFAEGVTFDVARAAADLAKLADAEAEIFRDDEPRTLRLMVMAMPAGEASGGGYGTSLTASAALWMDGTAPWSSEQARSCAHEMFHLYNGQVIQRRPPDPVTGFDETGFFAEGFTEHYTDELMLRAGASSAREWFETVRSRIRDYHAHPDAETPNDRADMRWGGRAMQLPYLRGSLLAAWLDAAIRARSNGGRTLDDFMRRLLARARSGRPPVDARGLIALVSDEIGDAGGEAFERFALRGVRVVLPAAAYGPCVEVIGAAKTTDLRVRPGVDLAKCQAARRI